MSRSVADIVEIRELKAEVADLLKVAEAAAYLDYRWGGGRWDVSAVWRLKDALSKLPAEKLALLRVFAEDLYAMDNAAASERKAKFDAAMAENKIPDAGSLVVIEEHKSTAKIRRTVLVISDAVYFRNYTWDKGDEFVNNHPNGKVKTQPGLVTMTCNDLLRQTLNSWDKCDVEVVYNRIASSNALRGISGKVDVVWQDGYKPRGVKEFSERLKEVSRSD